MKNIKPAVLAAVFLLFTAFLTACTTTDIGFLTVEDYALQYIDSLAQEVYVGIFDYDDNDKILYTRQAKFIETRINVLEKEAEFNNFTPNTIELWRLDFMLLTEDLETNTLRWGTFFPDADGWVGQHTEWNNARTLLVFSRDNGKITFMGSIPWYMEETLLGLEGALRTFLGQ